MPPTRATTPELVSPPASSSAARARTSAGRVRHQPRCIVRARTEVLHALLHAFPQVHSPSTKARRSGGPPRKWREKEECGKVILHAHRPPPAARVVLRCPDGADKDVETPGCRAPPGPASGARDARATRISSPLNRRPRRRRASSVASPPPSSSSPARPSSTCQKHEGPAKPGATAA
ncbi:hypothetical protein FB451DRAFT_1258805 [Mycena latifolia]|nr:hypothetical protein FB451DRAFT_1258805 [Mycena latifolia]